MATVYRVRDWPRHFETHESRKLKTIKWVAVPNKHDGRGFRRLIHAGPDVFGAWILILQVASKCPERGVLADADGPLTPEDLEAKTGCPATVFAAALKLLCSPAIGWMEAVQVRAGRGGKRQRVPPAAGTPAGAGGKARAHNITPPNRTEPNTTEQRTGDGGPPEGGPAAVDDTGAPLVHLDDEGHIVENEPVNAWDPVVCVVPLRRKGLHVAVLASRIKALADQYPLVDVQREFTRPGGIRVWNLDAAPSERKTPGKHGFWRHVANWLDKEQKREARALKARVSRPGVVPGVICGCGQRKEEGAASCGACAENYASYMADALVRRRDEGRTR